MKGGSLGASLKNAAAAERDNPCSAQFLHLPPPPPSVCSVTGLPASLLESAAELTAAAVRSRQKQAAATERERSIVLEIQKLFLAQEAYRKKKDTFSLTLGIVVESKYARHDNRYQDANCEQHLV